VASGLPWGRGLGLAAEARGGDFDQGDEDNAGEGDGKRGADNLPEEVIGGGWSGEGVALELFLKYGSDTL
jgi:hypothetical protein